MSEGIPRTAREMREVLADAGISLRKAIGQHYLIDPNLRAALVKDAAIEPGEIVLEVGVGLGLLTAGLLDAGAIVLGVEIDEAVLNLTQSLLPASQLADPSTDGKADVVTQLMTAREQGRGCAHLVRANILKRKEIDAEVRAWLDALRSAAPEARLRLVANLPYQIASPLIVSLLEWRPAAGPGFDGVATMVQWEVAQRLCAEPASEMYGGLSVLCQAHATWRTARRIPPSVFMPRPKVDSGFVLAKVHEPTAPFPLGLSATEYALFKQLVQAAFQYRRKHLIKALTLGTGIPQGQLEHALLAQGVEPQSRGEVLTPQTFADLARRLNG